MDGPVMLMSPARRPGADALMGAREGFRFEPLARRITMTAELPPSLRGPVRSHPSIS